MRKVIKTLTALLVSVLTAFSFVSCTLNSLFPPKTFTKEGMSITLTVLFEEKEYEDQTVCYYSPGVVVFALKEEFSKTEGLREFSLDDYASAVISVGELDCEYAFSEKGYAYFEYAKELDGSQYNMYATCHKTEDAFWLIQFACFTESYEKLKPEVLSFAESIVFGEETALESEMNS